MNYSEQAEFTAETIGRVVNYHNGRKHKISYKDCIPCKLIRTFLAWEHKDKAIKATFVSAPCKFFTHYKINNIKAVPQSEGIPVGETGFTETCTTQYPDTYCDCGEIKIEWEVDNKEYKDKGGYSWVETTGNTWGSSFAVADSQLVNKGSFGWEEVKDKLQYYNQKWQDIKELKKNKSTQEKIKNGTF